MMSNIPVGTPMVTTQCGDCTIDIALLSTGGKWDCRKCDAAGEGPDHVVVRGEAAVHSHICSGGDMPWRLHVPVRGTQYGPVVVGELTWRCDCGVESERIGGLIQRTIDGISHAITCDSDDAEAVLAQAVSRTSAMQKAMSNWVAKEVEAGLSDKDTEVEVLRADVERAKSAAAAAVSERQDVLEENRLLEQRLNADIAAALAGDADRLRAEVTKPDLKASVLVAAAVGAVVAGGGALGGADLPVAAIGTGAGAVIAAVAAVVTLLVAMRPGVSTDPDTLVTSNIRDVEGQVEQARTRTQTPDLDALARERAGLQRLALRKFKLVRWAIDGALGSIGLAGVTAAVGAVSALVGGA